LWLSSGRTASRAASRRQQRPSDGAPAANTPGIELGRAHKGKEAMLKRFWNTFTDGIKETLGALDRSPKSINVQPQAEFLRLDAEQLSTLKTDIEKLKLQPFQRPTEIKEINLHDGRLQSLSTTEYKSVFENHPDPEARRKRTEEIRPEFEAFCQEQYNRIAAQAGISEAEIKKVWANGTPIKRSAGTVKVMMQHWVHLGGGVMAQEAKYDMTKEHFTKIGEPYELEMRKPEMRKP
jgi:hypothetical protein